MKSLIKIEWLKIKKYPVFWWMLGIVFLTYPSINLMFYKAFSYTPPAESKEAMATGILKAILGEPYAFPEVWHNVAFFSSVFIVIPAILVVMLINNEYTYKTNRQNIIDGWNRKDFVLSKLIDVAIISVAITVVYMLTTIIFGLANDASLVKKIFEKSYYIPLFLLQTFSQLSIAFLCGYFIRKSFLALGAFIIYNLVIENIIVGFLDYYKVPITRFFPFEISDKLIPRPAFFDRFSEDGMANYQKLLDAIPLHIVLTTLLTSGIWYLCFKNYAKKDL